MSHLKIDPAYRIQRLAESIPSLVGAAGVDPWDALQFAQWASGGRSHGEICAARFVLAVWNRYDEWPCGPFDVMEALRVWDDRHVAAFAAWAANPWWA